MYCSKCGKFIDYDAKICNECKAEEEMANLEVQATPVEGVQEEPAVALDTQVEPVQLAPASTPTSANTQKGSIMTGFGKALTGVILSIIALSLTFVVLGFVLDAEESLIATGRVPNDIEQLLLGGAIMCFAVLGLSIPSIVLGSKSIKVYKAEKLLGNKKPIPALILGIYGLVCGICMLFCAISLFALCLGLRAF